VRKIRVIIAKEWREVFKHRFVLFTVVFMPLMLTAIPLVILFTMQGSGDLAGLAQTDMPPQFARLCEGLGSEACAQYFLVSQFMLLFMLLPLAIPVTIASYSIVGEKTTRTLEPLLATPIRTWELLVGKSAAAALPAIGATWLAFGVFVAGASIGAPGILVRLLDALWLVAIFVVGPLLAVAAVCVAVMVSSRVNEPRAAEQITMLMVLPLLGLFFGQISGLILVDQTLVLWMALGVGLLDAVLMVLAVQLFQRETILTRWK